MRQENGTDLLGLDDPRSQSIGIIYVSPNDDRKSVLAAIITQEKLGRKHVAVVLPNQNAAFQRPVDFDDLKSLRRKLHAQLIFIAESIGASGPAYYARQRNFTVYSSLDTFKNSLQDQDVPPSENKVEKRSGFGLFGSARQKSVHQPLSDEYSASEQQDELDMEEPQPPLMPMPGVAPIIAQTPEKTPLPFRSTPPASSEDFNDEESEGFASLLEQSPRPRKVLPRKLIEEVDADQLPSRLQEQQGQISLEQENPEELNNYQSLPQTQRSDIVRPLEEPNEDFMEPWVVMANDPSKDPFHPSVKKPEQDIYLTHRQDEQDEFPYDDYNDLEPDQFDPHTSSFSQEQVSKNMRASNQKKDQQFPSSSLRPSSGDWQELSKSRPLPDEEFALQSAAHPASFSDEWFALGPSIEDEQDMPGPAASAIRPRPASRMEEMSVTLERPLSKQALAGSEGRLVGKSLNKAPLAGGEEARKPVSLKNEERQASKPPQNEQAANSKIERDPEPTIIELGRRERSTAKLPAMAPTPQPAVLQPEKASVAPIPAGLMVPQVVSGASLQDDQQPALQDEEELDFYDDDEEELIEEDEEDGHGAVVVDSKASKKRNTPVGPVFAASAFNSNSGANPPPRNPRRKRGRGGWWLVAVILFLIVLLLGGGTIWAYSHGQDPVTAAKGLLSGGAVTIDLTPDSKSISHNYVVTLSGTPAPNTLQIASRDLEGKQGGTQKIDPKGHAKTDPIAAKGSFTFTSLQSSDFTMGTNTPIAGPNGMQYYLDGSGTIPRAKVVNGTLEPGKLTVNAHASSAGAKGNLNAGQINQTCCVADDYIKVVNNSAFTGGQDGKDYNYVLQDDYNSAVAQLKQDTETKARSAVQSSKQGGEEFATDISCETKDSSDQPIGDKGSGVGAATVSVNSTCKAVAYDKQAMTKLITQKLQDQAAKDAGAGYVLKGEPTIDSHVQTENTPLTVQVASKGQWVYQFTDQDKQAITQSIAGKTVTDAKTILASRTGVKIASITYSGESLPTDLSLITINIKDAPATQDGTTIPVGTVTPSGTPAIPDGTTTGTPGATTTTLSSKGTYMR